MCGIIGYYCYYGENAIEPALFDRVVDSLAHRGPDGRGVHLEPGVGLGHRRLAIIDISDRGRQPMSTPDQTVWLTYNGEIYNFQELRAELEQLGHQFLSTSDTEVLLHAYLEWELACINRIRGIFAFAIWDRRKQRLWLVRDHLGVKPLYYADYEGTLYFASEIVALLAIPAIPKELDPYGLDAFFTLSYVPAPATGYAQIKQLLPAQYLAIEKQRQHLVSYWDVPIESATLQATERDCVEQFDTLLTQVVHRQMVSDVPLGVFLSSGTDSFAVARAMQKVTPERLIAFSIGFDQKRYDELPYAEVAAHALNVSLISQRFPREANEALFQQVADHCQDPFADSSCLPVYLLAQVAAQHVKVVLSGDGADELLAGYTVYQANQYAQWYRKIPHWIRAGFLKPMTAWAPDMGGKYTLREKVRRFLYGAEQGPWRDHASWRVICTQALKQQFYTPEFYRNVQDADPLQPYVAAMRHAKQRGCSDLNACLYADLKFYLPNDMLVKVDRMSMAHGLEARVPFLDLDLVNFCWQLPESFKIRQGVRKYLLRQIISDRYPAQLQKLPKSGFNVEPIKWPRTDQRASNPFYNFHPAAGQTLPFSAYSHFLCWYCAYVFNNTYQLNVF